MNKKPYTFDISLSILNHLGRNLYRSFITVLGEAISNSWDADAENVWIYLDRDNNKLVVKDDGIGMTEDDFQNKFLTIGYSKRGKNNDNKTTKGRPFIGRKGIGKLALLSCAETISVMTKTKDSEYTGGTINNSELDEAIDDNLKTSEYKLNSYNDSLFSDYKNGHEHGTIIIFEKIHEGIKNREEYLKQMIALYFTFSTIDETFNIYVNKEKVTVKDLEPLANKTQFLWKINIKDDPYFKLLENSDEFKEAKNMNIECLKNIKGFLASVEKPSNLKILTTDQKATIDIFVNGRIREKDFLTTHMPSDRIAASYFYGQIHFNDLDDDTDRFTTAREGIVSGDKKYDDFLSKFKKEIFSKIIYEWDDLRKKYRKSGDPENEKLTRIEKGATELNNAIKEDIIKFLLPSKDDENSKSNKDDEKKINDLIDVGTDDQDYNAKSYMQCFILENLLRNYIEKNNINIGQGKEDNANKYKNKELDKMKSNSINIKLRSNDSLLNYLASYDLIEIMDSYKSVNVRLKNQMNEYTLIRNVLMHTVPLTKEAKTKLESIHDNIKGYIKKLLDTN